MKGRSSCTWAMWRCRRATASWRSCSRSSARWRSATSWRSSRSCTWRARMTRGRRWWGPVRWRGAVHAAAGAGGPVYGRPAGQLFPAADAGRRAQRLSSQVTSTRFFIAFYCVGAFEQGARLWVCGWCTSRCVRCFVTCILDMCRKACVFASRANGHHFSFVLNHSDWRILR